MVAKKSLKKRLLGVVLAVVAMVVICAMPAAVFADEPIVYDAGDLAKIHAIFGTDVAYYVEEWKDGYYWHIDSEYGRASVYWTNWDWDLSDRSEEYFVDSVFLPDGFARVSTIDLSDMKSLAEVQFYNTEIASLNVSGSTNLRSLTVYGSRLTELDVSGLTELLHLSCESNQLTELDVSGLTSLEYLSVYGNSIDEIDVSSNIALEALNAGEAVVIGLENTAIKGLVIRGRDAVESVNFSNLTNLVSLSAYQIEGGNLTEIDLSQNINLKRFYYGIVDSSTTLKLPKNIELFSLVEAPNTEIVFPNGHEASTFVTDTDLPDGFNTSGKSVLVVKSIEGQEDWGGFYFLGSEWSYISYYIDELWLIVSPNSGYFFNGDFAVTGGFDKSNIVSTGTWNFNFSDIPVGVSTLSPIFVANNPTPSTPTPTVNPPIVNPGGGGGTTTKPTAAPTAKPTAAPTAVPTTAPVKPAETPFTDVAAKDWYAESVKFVYENNLFGGVSANSFAPEMTMNRAMMVQVLFNLAGKPESGAASFGDVAYGAWYYDAVAWAANNEIVSGVGGGRFDPDSSITREQMAVILYNYTKTAGIELPVIREVAAFSDANQISPWAVEALDVMYSAGILNGKGNGGFDPKGTATRAEVATLFMNFVNAMK